MSDEDFPDPCDARNSEDYALDSSGSTPLPSAKGKRSRKKKGPTTFKKAPQAPKRFKSSYIFFSMDKMEELKKSGAKVTNNSTRIAEMWRNLPEDERKKWDEIAKKDKIRFMAEKALYTGPWQVPSKRVKKDPSAPKRPMSAFLFFSQGKRQELKKQNPGMKNTEISTRLGEMWKKLSDEDRQPFIDTEVREREKYKKEMSAWRSQRVSEEEAEKKRKEAIVDDFIKSGFVPGSEAPPVPVTAPGQGTAAVAPPMPPPMAAGLVPFPPPMMMPPGMPPPGMPPVPMPVPMPPDYDSNQKSGDKSHNQQEGGQSGQQGTQHNQTFYPGYYYPMYPYPYPMPMVPSGVYPATTMQPVQPQPQTDAGVVGTASSECASEIGEQGETV